MAHNQSAPTYARGSAINLGGRFLGRMLYLVAQTLLARWLSPSYYGLFAIGWNVFRFFGLFAPLGVDAGIVHFGMRYGSQDQTKVRPLITLAILIAVVIGGFWGLLWVVTAGDLAHWFGKPDLEEIFRLFGVALPFYIVLRVASACTRISKSMTYSNIVEEIVPSSVNLMGVIVLVGVMGWSAGSVWAVIFSFGIGLLYALRYIQQLYPFSLSWPPYWRADGQALLKFSLSAMLGASLGSLIIMVDRLFVGFFLPSEAAGKFQVATLLSVVFTNILMALKVAASPTVSELASKGDTLKLQALFSNSARWAWLIGGPVIVMCFLFPERIVQVVFGSAYLEGGRILAILVIGQALNLLTGVGDVLLIMSGHPKEWVKITFFMLAVNIICQLVFIPLWGLSGAAWATTLSLGGISVWGVWRVYQILKIHPFDKHYAYSVLLLSLGGGLMWVFSKVFLWSGIHLGLAVVISSLLMAFALWQFALKENERKLLWGFIKA